MDGKQVAGVAELPQASNINGCDSQSAEIDPAKTAGNPAECRTSGASGTVQEARKVLLTLASAPADRAEIDGRLLTALQAAGNSALGMPSSVDTFKAWLYANGLTLVLA